MGFGFQGRAAGSVQLLTDDECRRIHEGSLKVMEQCGVKFESERALEILEAAGCQVDRATQLVKFPPRVVEESIQRCPRTVTLYGLDPKYDMTLGEGKVFFGISPGIDVIDLETGQTRPGVLKDVGEGARLAEALENIHTVWPVVTWVDDVPLQLNSQVLLAEVLKNTRKTGIIAYLTGAEGEVQDLIEMYRLVAGGEKALRERPFAMAVVAPIPPLDNSGLNCDALIGFVEAGFPLCSVPGITGGATGPATLAGMLVQSNAEFLSNLVLAQLVNPGHPVICAHYNTIMDMRAGTFASGAVEYGIAAVGVVQLARYYHIPVNTYAMADAHVMDEQVAYEKSLQLLLGTLAGADLVSGGGAVTNSKVYSHQQLVLDNEILGMLGRVLEGIQVNDETLAVDLITRVGPLPGNYLREKHTTRWFRREFFFPQLSEKRSFDAWVKDGSKDVVAKAREKARTILDTYQSPVPDEVVKELDAFLESIKKREGLA